MEGRASKLNMRSANNNMQKEKGMNTIFKVIDTHSHKAAHLPHLCHSHLLPDSRAAGRAPGHSLQRHLITLRFVNSP